MLLNPIWFFATDIPKATPGALLPPTATATESVLTSASILETSSVETVTAPNCEPLAVVATLPPVMVALLVPSSVLKASEPPPLTPMELPVPTETPMEVAVAVAWICPDFLDFTIASPATAAVTLDINASTL